jgi:MFS family permease
VSQELEPPEAALPTRSIGRVLFSRDFGPLFAGNLISNSGTWFQNIAQVLLVYRLTGSTFLVGVVNFAQFAAIIFLATIAGRAADRFDRRRLLILTQASAAALTAALAALTGAGLAPAPVVIGFALALGVTTAFATPTLQALIPSLVSEDELPAAVALTAVTFNLSRALGPVLGVLVVANLGIATAFLLNSLSFVALIAALLVVVPRPQRITPAGEGPDRIGLRFLFARSALFAPIVVVGIVSLTMDPVNTLTPAFSTEILDRQDTFAGYLVGAFGAGAVVAAFVIARFAPTFRVLTVTLATEFVGILAFAMSSTIAVSVVALTIAGFGYLASVTAATSLLHRSVEDSQRGRVMAFWSMSFHGVRPFGSLFDGFLAEAAGVRAAGLAMSMPAAAGAVGMALLGRRRRRDV